jgi:cell division protein FtsI (penicillin-binding protein 3)
MFLEQRVGRRYPQGRLAAQVVGFFNLEGRGAAGIELQFDRELQGQPGRRLVRRDARQVRIADADELWLEPPRDGQDLELTLRLPVQFAAERALDAIEAEWQPRSAVAVVLEIGTGDILAMASRPTFDPNRYSTSDPEAWKARAITDVFEPGSTMKPFTVATALQAGTVTLQTLIDCEQGTWMKFGRPIRDTHGHGRITVEEVIVNSSNIGAAKIALTLGGASEDLRRAKRTLHGCLTGCFNFGQPLGVPLPGEQAGLVRPPERWCHLDLTRVAFGYGVMVTPLQLASAYATLAGGGIYRRPRLVRAVGDDEQPLDLPRRRLDLCSPGRSLLEALGGVVDRGTARRMGQPEGWRLGGKTGTTRKLDPETGQYVSRYITSFAGVAPLEAPRYVCVIMVDDPEGGRAGGTVAAPAVRQVLELTLAAQDRWTAHALDR